MNTTDKGPVLIKRELKEKGISPALIEKAIVQYPFEAQLETAQKLCEKLTSRNKRIRKGFEAKARTNAYQEGL